MKVITAAGSFEIGTTEATPTIGITDFSRRVTDDFGVTTVVERGFSRRLSVRMAVPFEQTDGLQRRLADLRATSALWVASEQHEWLRAEGYYKEFELDLAVPPLSFCTLTVEGLAQTEVVADVGGDPAPDGQPSTLQLLQPVTVDDDVLVASNVAENDAPVWSVFATYPKGAIAIRGGERFESLIDANEGHVPGDSVAEWLLLGPTNRWAMFDGALGTATIAAGSIVVQLDAPGADGLALLDVVAATVRVQASGYDRMQQAGSGTITFLDLPAGTVTVTIAGPGQVSVGTLLIGQLVGLGITEASPTAGITDFSRKEVDDFGEVTIVQRAWAKRMAARALIRTDALDTVANRIAAVRARPSLWIGQAGVDAITVLGFFKEFSIEVGPAVSKLSLSVEGLSKAAPPAPPTKVNWPDVVDSDPDRPRPADGATVGAPAGTPVGDLPSQIVADAMKAMADAPTGEDVVAGARALLQRTMQTVEALRELVASPDQDGLLTGARALVERMRANQASQLAAQLLGEARKQRTDVLLHLDGIPMGTRVRQEIVQRIEGDAAIVERIVELTAKTETDVGELVAAIQEEARLRADADSAETAQREAAISAVTILINDETAARVAAITAEATTRADAISAETAQREAAISTVTGLIGDETAAREAAILAEQQTRADAISAETLQREAAISTVTGLIGDETAAREAAIIAEQQTRADAISAETQQREAAISQVTGLVDDERIAREAAITSERETSATELAAETLVREASISTVTGLIGDETAAREAAISAEATTRADAIFAETEQREAAISQVTGLVDGERQSREAAIAAERLTSATELAAETLERETAISTVTGLIGDETAAREAAIVAEQQTRADEIGAVAQQTEALSARSTGAGNMLPDSDFASWGSQLDAKWWSYSDNANVDIIGLNVAGDLWRPAGEDVLSVRQLGSAAGASVTFVGPRVSIRKDKWYQGYASLAAHRCPVEVMIEYYRLDGAPNGTAFSGVVMPGAGGSDPDNWTIVGIPFSDPPANSTHASLLVRKHNTNPDQADSYMWFWRPYFGEARDRQEEWNPWAPGSGASALTQIGARISAETQARADAISAETLQRETAISAVTALIDGERSDREAAIVAEQQTRADAISAETQQREGAISTVTGLIDAETAAREAAITAEQQTRADAVSAETQARELAISTVTGLIGDETAARQAAITGEATTRADAISAETQQREAAISQVTGLVDGERSAREAAILSEQTTRADEIGAVAQTVQSLGTTVDGQSASVEFLLEAIDGNEANAQLVTNVNGRITGFRVNGQESLFFIEADRFIVGSNQIFEIVDNQARFRGNLVVDGTLEIGKLDRSTMTAVTQGSVTGLYGGFNTGLAYVPNLGASMTIRDGGSLYISYTGGSGSTSSAFSAAYNSIEILDAGGGVLQSIKLPFHLAGDQLENYLMRIPNVWGARTIQWRVATRGNDQAYSNVNNPNVTVNWSML